MKRERRRLLAVVIATVSYVLFEMGFSASLLDLVGGVQTTEAVQVIREHGRWLTAAALWIMLLPWMFNRLSWIGFVLMLAPSYGVAWGLQESALVLLSRGYDAPDRQHAVFLALASDQLATGDLEIEGLLTPSENFSGIQKVFVAMMPMITLSREDLPEVIRALGGQMIHARLTRCETDQSGCYGSFAYFSNNLWTDVIEKAKEGYAVYREVTKDYQSSIEFSLPREQKRAWNNYLEKLRRRGVLPNIIPKRNWWSVADEVQRAGVKVPNGWDPKDKATFYEAVANDYRDKARAKASGVLLDKLGVDVFTGDLMSFPKYFEHPKLQERMRERLDIDDASLLLPMVTKSGDIRREVYEKVIAWQVNRQMARLTGSPNAYAHNGVRHAEGEDAINRVVIPVMALILSLAGLLVHVCKTVYYLIWLVFGFFRSVTRNDRIAFAVLVLALFGGFASAVSDQSFRLLETQAYHELSEAFAQKHGRLAAAGVEWVIKAHASLYPVNELVRTWATELDPFGDN